MTRQIEINLSGSLRMIDGFLPHLLTRSGALIVNVSFSLHGSGDARGMPIGRTEVAEGPSMPSCKQPDVHLANSAVRLRGRLDDQASESF